MTSTLQICSILRNSWYAFALNSSISAFWFTYCGKTKSKLDVILSSPPSILWYSTITVPFSFCALRALPNPACL